MIAEKIQSVPHGFIKTFLDNLEAEFKRSEGFTWGELVEIGAYGSDLDHDDVLEINKQATKEDYEKVDYFEPSDSSYSYVVASHVLERLANDLWQKKGYLAKP